MALKNLKETRFGDWSCGSFHCFLVFYCLLTSIQRIPGPFMGTLMQSIERQFQISSTVSGTLISARDIGHISAVVFLAYFGSRGNRARWIGCAGLLIAFACFLMSSPGFLFPQTDKVDEKAIRRQGYNVSRSKDFNSDNSSIDPILMADAKLPFGYCNNETMHLKAHMNKAKCEMQTTDHGNAAAYYLVLTGIVLLGVGRSMPHTLGMPLIDDSVKNKRNTPIYFAAINCLRIFGPIFGMVLAAVCAGLYVDFKPPPGMTPYDPRWIGAWWLGFVVAAAALLGPAVVLMCYPNVDTKIKERQEAYRLKKKQQRLNGIGKGDSSSITNGDNRTPTKEKVNEKSLLDQEKPTEKSILDNSNEKQTSSKFRNAKACFHIIGIATAIVEILKSPIYTGRLLGRMLDAFAFKGMSAFRSKYLENHFGIPMYKANISIGLLGIGSYMSGVLLGTLMMRKFNLDGRRAAAYVAFCSIMATILTLSQSFLSCHAVVNQVGREGLKNNFTYPACSGCDCSSAPLYPVCSIDGTPYFSPCQAGCKDYNRSMFDVLAYGGESKRKRGGRVGGSSAKFVFHTCSCVDPEKNKGDQRVSRDWCFDDCYTPMILYFALSTLGAVIAGTSTIARTLIGLRSVPKEYRSVAMAFSTFAVGLISVLPSTPIYGMIIDAACLLWNTACGGRRGACLIYDPTKLRRGIITMYVIFHGIGDLCDVFVWYKAKNMKLMSEDKEEKDNEEKPKGIVEINVPMD